MKLIVDENLHRYTVEILLEYGFSIVTIEDILHWGALDEDIYEYASNNNIAIITHDRRFGQFYFDAEDKPPTTIVLEVVTPHPYDTNILLKRSLAELALLSSTQYHNKLIILNRSKIRIRG